MDDRTDEPDGVQAQGVANHLSGAAGHVIQAGAIHGDVTINVPQDVAAIGTPLIITAFHDSPRLWADEYDLVVLDGKRPRLLNVDDELLFYVEGRGSQAVILLALRAVVVTDREPRTAYAVPKVDPVLASTRMHTRDFQVVLAPGRKLEVEPCGGWSGKFPFTVTAGDPERFSVVGRSSAGEVRWRLELDWMSGGRRGTETIDVGGKPLHSYPRGAVADGLPPAHLHDFLLAKADRYIKDALREALSAPEPRP